jgi:hypothetical protein
MKKKLEIKRRTILKNIIYDKLGLMIKLKINKTSIKESMTKSKIKNQKSKIKIIRIKGEIPITK